jgi:hypothetical protein
MIMNNWKTCIDPQHHHPEEEGYFAHWEHLVAYAESCDMVLCTTLNSIRYKYTVILYLIIIILLMKNTFVDKDGKIARKIDE